VLKRVIVTSFSVILFISCAHSGSNIINKDTVGSITLIPRLHFAFDSDRLTPEGRGVIYHNAGWMRENPTEVVILEGHCDSRGSADYNLYLGDRRARVVRAEMREFGIDDDSLAIISYGEKRPLVNGHNTRAWMKNRRVEFVVR